MKQIQLFSLVTISACLLLACSDNATNANKNNAADAGSTNTAQVAQASSSDKGTITCTMNGKPRTFTVHNSFFEMRLETDSQGPNDGVELLDGNATNEGFQFELKNKGISVFKGMDGVLNMLNYFNGKGATYVADEDMMATINSFDGNHLTGTFSGKFQNTNYKGGSDGNPEFIQITDGKFELNK